MVVGSYTIQILYKVWNQQRTSYSLSSFLPSFFPFSSLSTYAFSLSLFSLYIFFLLLYFNNRRYGTIIERITRSIRIHEIETRNGNLIMSKLRIPNFYYHTILSRVPMMPIIIAIYSYYADKRYYRTVIRKKEERKRFVRKFMRDRRELLLLNKTLKYLITVPVISVEGNGIGAMFSSFVRLQAGKAEGHF